MPKQQDSIEPNWINALRGLYGDAKTEAQNQRVTNATECAQAIQFADLIRKVQKELQTEINHMNHELDDAAAILDFKIGNYRQGSLNQKSLFPEREPEKIPGQETIIEDLKAIDEILKEEPEDEGW
jgi:hypothetical protein